MRMHQKFDIEYDEKISF